MQHSLSIIITAVVVTSLIYLAYDYYHMHSKYNKQNIKAVNLYLDKKLILKLLSKLNTCSNEDTLESIIDDILIYFGIEVMVLKNESTNLVLNFKNKLSSKLLTEQDTKLMFAQTKKIKNLGYKKINNDDENNYVIFKNHDLLGLVVLEDRHMLSNNELDTLLNEIMIIIKIATSKIYS